MTRHEICKIMDFLIESAETLSFPGTETTLKYLPMSAIGKIDEVKIDEYEHKTLISSDYDLDDVATLLCDGLASQCAFEGVDYDDVDYSIARGKLISNSVDPTHELVEAQMILDGKRFDLIEVETGKPFRLTIEKIVHGLDKMAEEYMKTYDANKLHAIRMMFEEGDFFTYHNALQYAVFDEVVYG